MNPVKEICILLNIAQVGQILIYRLKVFDIEEQQYDIYSHIGCLDWFSRLEGIYHFCYSDFWFDVLWSCLEKSTHLSSIFHTYIYSYLQEYGQIFVCAFAKVRVWQWIWLWRAWSDLISRNFPQTFQENKIISWNFWWRAYRVCSRNTLDLKLYGCFP